MVRSFTDRVFGGVCGGLAASLRINAWILRFLFVILALASVGTFAVAYLILWWLTPQGSPVTRRRGLPVILVFVLLALAIALWVLRLQNQLITPYGTDLYLPILAFALALVFFLRQFGRRA